MGNRMDEFEVWATRARQEQPPSTDVSQRVLQSLRAEPVTADTPFALFALTSMATAAAVVVLTFSSYQVLSDPITTLFETTPLLGL